MTFMKPGKIYQVDMYRKDNLIKILLNSKLL